MTPEDAAEALDALLPQEKLTLEELATVKEHMMSVLDDVLDSHRQVFSIGPQSFSAALWREPENDAGRVGDSALFKGAKYSRDSDADRTVSAAALRILRDWCQHDWPMLLGDYLSGMFHGKQWDRKTPPWKLIPTVEQRLTAESLGLDHLYPPKE